MRILAIVIVVVGLAGWAVMGLWNALLPTILGVSAISFGQALGLLVLSRLLFGGRPGWGGPRGWQGSPARGRWKEKLTERWQHLSPEQREAMKTQWRNRCGDYGRDRWERGRQQAADQPGPDNPPPTGPDTEPPTGI